MALLGAVVFRQDQPQCLTCRTCGGARCVLCCYGGGGGGELGRIERGVVVQPPREPVEKELVGVPRAGGGGVWAGMATCVGPVPSLAAPARPPPHVPASAGHVVVAAPAPAVRAVRKRRRKAAAARSTAEAESQRLNHIAVERNRRRQMNEYLAVLRSLMPPSYARRGDQASIVGGAINFVKELEHRVHSLQAQKRHAAGGRHRPEDEPFAGFFTLPQYSTSAAAAAAGDGDASITRPGVADVEAAVSEGHATVKLLLPPLGRRPAQRPRRRMLLRRLLLGLQRRGLAALHLNVTTTADEMALYTFSLSMGDGCQLSSAGDVAAAVHDMVADMSTADLELAALN
ncbi:hypothetical protein ACP4OV_016965 [Aristida adscensionis]